MLTRFWFDSSSVARKGSVGTVTVKQACGQPEKTARYPGRPGICRLRLHEGGAVPERGNPMYLLRYYDYDWEDGKTIGIYSTPDILFATIVDKYPGQVDISKIELPDVGNCVCVRLDGDDYGESLRIESIEID